MQTTDLLSELRKEARNQNLEFLTIEKATELKGKRIQTIYFGYADQDGVADFIVGDLISHFDLAKLAESNSGFKNRAEYWESYMSKSALNDEKENITILTDKGEQTYINAHGFNRGSFTCSDSDRYVQFRVVKDA